LGYENEADRDIDQALFASLSSFTSTVRSLCSALLLRFSVDAHVGDLRGRCAARSRLSPSPARMCCSSAAAASGSTTRKALLSANHLIDRAHGGVYVHADGGHLRLDFGVSRGVCSASLRTSLAPRRSLPCAPPWPLDVGVEREYAGLRGDEAISPPIGNSLLMAELSIAALLFPLAVRDFSQL